MAQEPETGEAMPTLHHIPRPRAETWRPGARAGAAARKESLAAPLDVLVAEDNEVNQLVFSQVLAGLALNYRIAANGRTALEMYKALAPRIMLMDISMPEMNGYEATAAIRASEEGSPVHTPIIGITAHALEGDREKCLAAGMDDYLSKPISPNRLATKIELWLERREERTAASA